MRPLLWLLAFATLTVAMPAQDSLYMAALDAEDEGRLEDAIRFFGEALEVGGEYDEELAQILNEYGEALAPSWEWRFFLEASGKYIYYDQESDLFTTREHVGELSVRGYTGLDFHHAGVIYAGGVTFSADRFFKDEESVLDTSDWFFNPGLSVGARGRTFDVRLAGGVEFDEDDFYIYTKASGEKDFACGGRHCLAGSLDYFGEEDYGIRAGAGLAWNYTGRRWSHSLGLGAYFVYDSVYATKLEYVPGDSTVPEGLDSDNTENSGEVPDSSTVSDSLSGGDELADYESSVEDSAHVAYGITRGMIGPRLRFFGVYQFDSGFSIGVTSSIFLGRDLVREAARFALDLNAGLRLAYRLHISEVFLSAGASYRHYLSLPSRYYLVLPDDRILVNVEAGALVDF